ncbi:hypothetical protein ACDP63_19410 [Paracoccus sp. P2]|uniref:hypothetical protein n=1 Tax=Paracoccus sp. P2 TaxID=3248840 RepID=UPI00391F1401
MTPIKAGKREIRYVANATSFHWCGPVQLSDLKRVSLRPGHAEAACASAIGRTAQ